MNEQTYEQQLEQIHALLRTLASSIPDSTLISDPTVGAGIVANIQTLLDNWEAFQRAQPPPPDKGLGQLAGVGPNAADQLGDTRIPVGVIRYDEQVAAERIISVGDLYYIYQHERIGVFRAVRKLQELFRAGAVRLSSGRGAFGLYQFDRREVLRYTMRDRHMAYRRAFGYGAAPVPPGSRANSEFHRLFTNFANEVALFWRDKRISDVVRTGALDPAFGSIAIVRRSGLDLRNNLKFMAFGHINVLRVEVMQVLEEAFKILDADDVKELFGAADGWDVVEEILVRYFNERLVTSPRQRMAETGREIFRWLAQSHILQARRGQFETLLLDIAEACEEWITSAQSLGLAQRVDRERSPLRRPSPSVQARRVTRTMSPRVPA